LVSHGQQCHITKSLCELNHSNTFFSHTSYEVKKNYYVRMSCSTYGCIPFYIHCPTDENQFIYLRGGCKLRSFIFNEYKISQNPYFNTKMEKP
jgi:hypothetical protein